MENKDIGLLKYCFSTSGQKKQKEAAAYLHKAAECLRKAGAISVTEENGKGCVIFQIKSGKNWENRDCIRYNISILSGARQISLKQERLWNEKVIASRLLEKEMRFCQKGYGIIKNRFPWSAGYHFAVTGRRN